MDLEYVTIDNLAGGAIRALFQEEFRRVLENIRDPGADLVTKRQIILTVSVVPDKKDPEGPAAVTVESKSKLSAPKMRSGFLFVSEREGELRAYLNDPRQLEFAFAGEGGVSR